MNTDAQVLLMTLADACKAEAARRGAAAAQMAGAWRHPNEAQKASIMVEAGLAKFFLSVGNVLRKTVEDLK